MTAPTKPSDGSVQVGAIGRQYEAVAANQATAVLGSDGAIGDTIDQMWLFPATTTPGAISLFDGVISVWTWPAGITLSNLAPIFIPLNLKSVSGSWNVTTGANVAILASGLFS